MGYKNGILVFTSLKLHAPIIIKYVFVLPAKNNGLLNWQEGKENSSNAFPAKIISCIGGCLLTGKIL